MDINDIHADLTDAQVIQGYELAWADLAHYLAAEGPSWTTEAAERALARQLFESFWQTLKLRDIAIPPNGLF